MPLIKPFRVALKELLIALLSATSIKTRYQRTYETNIAKYYCELKLIRLFLSTSNVDNFADLYFDFMMTLSTFVLY